MTGTLLTGSAPAKINLTLEVLARRDDGYHGLATILQTLSLADSVAITFDTQHGGVEVSGPFASGTPATAENLAWRAAEELARLTKRSCEGISIAIVKHIPAAGGLGGGASDAATTLRLLQTLWGATEDQLIVAANEIGSDESAFVLGGRVLATGRGDIVRRLPDGPHQGVVLFVPPTQLEGKTRRLFRELDTLDPDTQSVTMAALEDPGRVWSGEDVFNSFERVAFDVFSGLDTLQADLEARIGSSVRLAGAGPTLFWLGPLSQRENIASRAEGADCTVIPTETAASLWPPS